MYYMMFKTDDYWDVYQKQFETASKGLASFGVVVEGHDALGPPSPNWTDS